MGADDGDGDKAAFILVVVVEDFRHSIRDR